MSSLLSVLDRIAKHTPQPFVAPIPDLERVRLFTLQDDIPYWFHAPKTPGWWRVIPKGGRYQYVTQDRLAYPCEYVPYLEQLPRFYVFALYPLSRWTWLCVPANSADAEQRGWPNGEPRPLHLVRYLSREGIAQARQMGDLMLFDDVSHRATGWPRSDVESAESLIGARQREFERKLEEERRKQRLATAEGQMEYMLGLSGAELDSWSALESGYRVTWSHNGRTNEMVLNRNMTVRSAGVCLDGTDQTHDLASIVQVMLERER
jgi:hypothetical protein